MPYIFNWHDQEHTIIRIDIVGQVSWEEYNIVVDRVVDELAKATHRIDVIYNDKVGMPKGNPMPHLKASSARMTAHKSLGLITSVSSRSVSSFTKLMIDIMMRAYQIDNSRSGGFVATIEEALAIIEKSRTDDKVAAANG
jgi:hypothetical protein